jgi:hypothetical protein
MKKRNGNLDKDSNEGGCNLYGGFYDGKIGTIKKNPA